MANSVVHFEICGPDGPQLHRFYKTIFDWKIDANNPMGYGLVPASDGGIGGGVTASDPNHGPPSSLTVYVSVRDINAHLEKITAAGGKVLMPRTVIPNMVTFAHFQDPAGNMVGLVEDMGTPPRSARKTKKKAAKKAGKKKAAKKKAAKKKAVKKRR